MSMMSLVMLLRHAKVFIFVQLIKTLGCFLRNQLCYLALIFLLKLFRLKQRSLDLFYAYFIESKVSVNFRNIKPLKYNGGIATLKTVYIPII